jgi:hypothetical protein
MRAWKLRKVVNQIPQQIFGKGRVVFDGPVFLGEDQVIVSIEGVVTGADISLIGLGAPGHILLIKLTTLLQQGWIILLSVNIIEPVQRLDVLSEELKSRHVFRILHLLLLGRITVNASLIIEV